MASSNAEQIQELLTLIVRMVVDKPNEVQISSVEQEGHVIFTVKTAPDDAGKLIGKSGRIIQSIREVVKAASFTRGIRPTIEVRDWRRAS